MRHLAARAAHRALAGQELHRTATATTEAVLPGPGTDLAGVAEHLEQVRFGLQEKLAQALPGGTGHFGGILEFEQVNTLAIEEAEGMFGQKRQILALQPVTGKEHAVTVGEELLPAMCQRPATRPGATAKAGLPAHLRQPPADPGHARFRRPGRARSAPRRRAA